MILKQQYSARRQHMANEDLRKKIRQEKKVNTALVRAGTHKEQFMSDIIEENREMKSKIASMEKQLRRREDQYKELEKKFRREKQKHRD
jgi:predicted nuclease with TOPRIM domain